MPNAVCELDALGLLGRLEERAVRTRELRYYHRSGSLVPYPMVDREPLERWSHGRTTLIGDAAHAMYPIGSNGATQSIVDGRALGHALALHADPEDALAAYEAARRPAMTELQRANRRLGPEVVINLAHQRAPGGFADINDVIPAAELAEIAARYAATGTFDAESVNQGSAYRPAACSLR